MYHASSPQLSQLFLKNKPLNLIQTETHTLLSLKLSGFSAVAFHWWDRSKTSPSWWATGRWAQERRVSAEILSPLDYVYKHQACILQSWRV